MIALRASTVGILPVGALGVSFFHHLTAGSQRADGAVFFVDRPGSSTAAALHAAGGVRLRLANGDVRLLPGARVLRGDLLACLAADALPELVLVACNPDQLLEVVTHLVALIVEAARDHGLASLARWLPTTVLCPNGIYFQRVRQIYIEKLEEAEFDHRLPHLRAEFLERIMNRFLRGVTIQTGVREGTGAGAVYRPGPRGPTRLAGGDAATRARTAAVLTARGGWFDDAGHDSPTRLEFEKGLINLATNLLGQITAISDDGIFRPMVVAEILSPQRDAQMRELARHVVAVGQAVGAYRSEETADEVHDRAMRAALVNRDHVTSSLQYVGLMLATGGLKPQLTPTEQWLIEPLIRYARSAGLNDAVAHFQQLRAQVIERLRRAIARAETERRPD